MPLHRQLENSSLRRGRNSRYSAQFEPAESRRAVEWRWVHSNSIESRRVVLTKFEFRGMLGFASVAVSAPTGAWSWSCGLSMSVKFGVETRLEMLGKFLEVWSSCSRDLNEVEYQQTCNPNHYNHNHIRTHKR